MPMSPGETFGHSNFGGAIATVLLQLVPGNRAVQRAGALPNPLHPSLGKPQQPLPQLRGVIVLAMQYRRARSSRTGEAAARQAPRQDFQPLARRLSCPSCLSSCNNALTDLQENTTLSPPTSLLATLLDFKH